MRPYKGAGTCAYIIHSSSLIYRTAHIFAMLCSMLPAVYTYRIWPENLAEDIWWIAENMSFGGIYFGG